MSIFETAFEWLGDKVKSFIFCTALKPEPFCPAPKPDPEEFCNSVFALYPGIEDVVKWGYDLHNYEKTDQLPWDNLEPMLRHLIWQIGELWIVASFCKTKSPDMNPIHIEPYLSQFGIDWRQPIDYNTFKVIVASFYRLGVETKAANVAKKKAEEERKQEIQRKNYIEALQTFCRTYAEDMAKRNREIAQGHSTLTRANVVFAQKGAQDGFYRYQMAQIDRLNDEAAEALHKVREANISAQQQIQQALRYQKREWGATWGQKFDEKIQAPLVATPGPFRRVETEADRRRKARRAAERQKKLQQQAEERAAELEREKAVLRAQSRGFSHVAIRVK